MRIKLNTGITQDNAAAENFFHSFKAEAIFGETFRTREEARRLTFSWLEGFIT